ncbi:MAG: hypothetical protein JXA30_01890 [Deltaproteobacteria bacterium]|nr:hypothetical protein [Deltaproteobacteria bacterium]
MINGYAAAQQQEVSVSTDEKSKAEAAAKTETADKPQTPASEPQVTKTETPDLPSQTPATQRPGERTVAEAPDAAPSQIAPSPLLESKGKKCIPACRSGFVCHQGACVSACNPPCEPNRRCSPEGECVVVYTGRYSDDDGEYAPEEQPIDPHHTGLFLHFGFGLGYSDLWRNKGDEVELWGGSTHYAVDLGWAVIENLIVHARLAFDDATDPVVEYDGRKYVDVRRSYVFVWKTLAAVTYYIMPINLYGTAAIGIERADITIDDIRLYDGLRTKGSDVGFALEVDIGKEWWAESEWGVGLSGKFGYANLPPEDSSSLSDRLHVITSGVLISITYN